jgi:hypothetical protein
MISYYNYCVRNGWFKGEIDSFLDFPIPYGDWGNHVNAALVRKAEHPERICIIKYESILIDPTAAVGELLGYLSVQVTPDMILRSVEKNSFSELQQKERVHGPEVGTTVGFFRNGTSEQWRRSLSPACMRRITKRFERYISALGYPLS